MNLWRDVPVGKTAPKEFTAIIEIPKGSSNKYEIDKRTGFLTLDRANYSSAPYPFDYGFIPQTLWEDDDPLDVVVLTTLPMYPGVLAHVRPVAIMDMVDAGQSDAKIIAVLVEEHRWESIEDLPDLHPRHLEEYKHFFKTYKQLKGDSTEDCCVTIEGCRGKQEAMTAIERAMTLYQQKAPL